ncbi:hypothetical protein KY346_00610 [Candidatus Woesearchaeota archaeon]|nr:hypothetical protein [Candidatus Woesearchaeota archaeon]
MMLEKIIKSARNLLLLGALAVTGCSAYAPLKSTNILDSKKVKTQVCLRSGIDYVGWTPHTTSEQRTVPIHPADGGSSRGKITTQNYYDCPFRPRLGIAGSLGNDSCRIKIGLDNMLNLGIMNGEEQDLPKPYESYGFSTFHPDLITFKPFIGLETEFLDTLLISLEAGITYSSFRLYKGHYRWADYEKIEKYSLGSGPGVFAGMDLALKLDKDIYFGARFGFENYFIDGRPDIQCYSGSLLLIKTFR